MTCPICDSKTISESYSEEPFGTVDWYCMCTMCDYAAQESYGAHRVSFSNNKWIWGYNTPESEVDRIQEEIDVALLNAKGKPSFSHRIYRYYSTPIDSPF